MSAKTWPDTTAPLVPWGINATVIGTSRIDLSWTASTDNVGVAGYRIYRDGTLAGVSAVTSYSDTGLTPGVSYSYSISAYDSTGNESLRSSSLGATTTVDNTAPSIPAGLTATVMGADRIDLTWFASTDDTAVVRYRVYRDGVQVGTTVTTVYSDTGLIPNTPYSYTVSALDISGNESLRSSVASATTWVDSIAPGVPGDLSAMGGDCQVSLDCV